MVFLLDFVGPTLIALIIFLIFYFIKPVFLSKANRNFLFIVIAEVIGFTANILSSYANNDYSQYSECFFILSNDVYYIAYVLRYLLFSLYLSSLLQIEKHKNVFFIFASIITALVSFLVIINPWTGFIYRMAPDGTFYSGKYIVLIYFSNLVNVFLDIYYLVLSFKKINLKEKITIICAVVVLLSCCIVDFLFIQYVISDIFLLLATTTLYLTFENPERYFDIKTRTFNTYAFVYSVSNNIYKNKNCPMYGFSIKNYSELKNIYGIKQIDLVLKEIGNYLLINFFKSNCYYLQNGNFAIIEKKVKEHSDIKQKIEKRFEQPWHVKNNANIQLKVMLVDVDKNLSFKNIGQMEACVKEAFFKSKNLENDITIDKKILDKALRNAKVFKTLNKSLSENSLKVYMQPIVDAKSRKIIAAEALVRMHDNELGIIPPDEFISVAEENGYIEKLGEQVLTKVCKFWNSEHFENYGIRWINVNLSPIQCQNKALLEIINDITASNNVKPEHIHLEITEESMIDRQILKKQLGDLVNNGYKIALDDFGSGFSNLYSIKAFPFSNIKLDMSLVVEHFNNPDNMLPSLVKMFRDRGLSVTAEGVETKEMADELEKMGCNYLQGYYFSKPIPVKDFLLLV